MNARTKKCLVILALSFAIFLISTLYWIVPLRLKTIGGTDSALLPDRQLSLNQHELLIYKHLGLLRTPAHLALLHSTLLEKANRYENAGDLQAASAFLKKVLDDEGPECVELSAHIAQYRILLKDRQYQAAAEACARSRSVLKHWRESAAHSEKSVLLTYGLEAYARRKVSDDTAIAVVERGTLAIRHAAYTFRSKGFSDENIRDKVSDPATILLSQIWIMSADSEDGREAFGKLMDELKVYAKTNSYSLAAHAVSYESCQNTNAATKLLQQSEQMNRWLYCKLYGFEKPSLTTKSATHETQLSTRHTAAPGSRPRIQQSE